MKIVGIIAEYNPLHNGHMLHINKIKEKNPDLIIGVISSTMTMRGDISIFDKFHKTKHALDAGMDLVIELPLAYAMQRADIFAKNAVELLQQCKVDEIIIGSEQNNISLYEEKYKLEKDMLRLDASMKNSITQLNDLSANDTLGYFYYKAIQDNSYNIKLSTIQRELSNYNDTVYTNDSIASATAIRENLNMLKQYVPSFVAKDKEYILEEEKLFSFIKYRILSMKEEELKEIFFVDEGIEYKLKDIKDFTCLEEYITYLSGKKYTKTRMKRMIMYILFNIKKEDMNHLSSSPIRILGYSTKGKEYLNRLKKETKIVTNIKNGISDVLDIELRVSKIIDSIYNTNLLELEQKGPIKSSRVEISSLS